jgi:hypothetical protein
VDVGGVRGCVKVTKGWGEIIRLLADSQDGEVMSVLYH